MNFSLTPPHELVDAWEDKYQGHMPEWVLRHVAAEAAQWGADQELEACIDFFGDQYTWDQLSDCTYWKQFRDDSETLLRAARRPEPTRLKERALALLDVLDVDSHKLDPAQEAVLRQALDWLVP